MRDDADDDETRPLDLSLLRHRSVADPEPAVAEALAVIQRAIRDLGTSQTRPLLDPPATPFRPRRIGATNLAVFPVVVQPSLADGVPPHQLLDAYAAAGGNAVLVDDGDDGVVDGVGGWLRASGRREQTVVIARIGDAATSSAAGLQAAADRLLDRLGTDHLDLLVLPGRAGGTSMEETLTAALALLTAGVVRFFAAGDHTPERLIHARVTAGQRALPRFDAVLPAYNVLDRAAYESGVAPVAHAQGLACLPVSPLAGGFLAGGVPSRAALRRLRELDPARAERIEPALTRRGMRLHAALLEIATARGSHAATVALAWLLTRPHVTAPVVVVAGVDQVEAATAAASLHLTRAEVQALDRAGRE